MAIIGSAAFLPGMLQRADALGECDTVTSCPTSQVFVTADIGEMCMAVVPDFRDDVVVDLCNSETSCYSVTQTPAPGTLVGVGDHEIQLVPTICLNTVPVRGNLNNNNDNMGNDVCGGDECFSLSACIVNLHVGSPKPELQCPDDVDPIQLSSDCSIVVPDLRNDATILACTETSGLVVAQEPTPGTVFFDPGDELSITLFIPDVYECSTIVPILPYTECPGDRFLEADPETCTTTMPADLCDSFIQECQVEEAGARQGVPYFYTCRTEPEAGTQLPIGDNEVRLIGQRCLLPGANALPVEDCEDVPELSCTVTIHVFAPPPTLICPETEPDFDPLQVSADCTVVVPDLRDLASVDACNPEEYPLMQDPEPGSTASVYDDYLQVRVYIEYGEGQPACYFYVPVNPILSCPDSPQTISLDNECAAVVPALTGDVVINDCCGERQLQRGDFYCGDIRITQDPEAGTPLTQETEVVITVERCYVPSFSQEARGLSPQDECVTLGTCTVVLKPIDDTPPVIENCPGDVTLDADADCLGTLPDLTIPDVTGLAIATDNCTADDEIVITQDPPAGTEIGLGDLSVTITATDAAGNSDTCTVNVFLAENGCLNPPAPEPTPEPQPVPGCDPNNQSLNLLFSLLFHSPVCGATCPITVSMMFCGFLALRRSVRRRRRR